MESTGSPANGDNFSPTFSLQFLRSSDQGARIAAGELKSGDRLPGERDLAEEYGVALGTIRRATQELRDRGLVRTVRVKGTFAV